jgi:hypothetical protein
MKADTAVGPAYAGGERTMMFRKLYWVTEEMSKNNSHVTGVYTSIPDLINHGLRWMNGSADGFRISLVKLDSEKEPLGTFQSPSFEGLETRLQDFIRTEEFTEEETLTLREALDSFASVKA